MSLRNLYRVVTNLQYVCCVNMLHLRSDERLFALRKDAYLILIVDETIILMKQIQIVLERTQFYRIRHLER